MLPPLHVNGPPSATLPVPASEPALMTRAVWALSLPAPFTVKVLLMFNVSVPLAAPRFRLLTDSLSVTDTAYVPGVEKTAVSLPPGTWFGLQFAGKFQFP